MKNKINITYSVVIPAFNAEKSLKKTLRSVIAQTVRPLEVIIVDDCSTDTTQEVAYASETEFRSLGIDLFYLCLEKNSGPSTARNTGIKMARGEYVSFIDSDDEWKPEKLQIVSEILQNKAYDLVCHSYTEVSQAPRKVQLRLSDYREKKLTTWNLLFRNPAQTSCAVVRLATGFKFNQSMRYCEDYDLWLRMIGNNCVALQLRGPALTILGRPQGFAGGLSSNRIKMRSGELRAFYNFCTQKKYPRIFLFPFLIFFSLLKHLLSGVRRFIL